MPDFGRFAHVYINHLVAIFPIRCAWCARRAEWTLVRVSIDGNRYVDDVCQEHADEWDQFQEGVQEEMEIE